MKALDPIPVEAAGHFVECENGKATVATKEPPKNFPIICGLWADVKRNVGVRQAKCCACETLIGLSESRQKFVDENPTGRPTMCNQCFTIARAIEMALSKDGEL